MFSAKCNFIANGIAKKKGEAISAEELALILPAAQSLVEDSGAPSPKVEVPSESPKASSSEDAPAIPSAHSHNGEKKGKKHKGD